MATATATAEIASARTSRWTYLLAYLAAVIVAEILIAIPGPPNGEGRPFQPIGLAMHILLVFTLMFASVFLQTKDTPLASLLVAGSLGSLVRVFSLAVPRFNFIATPETDPLNTIPWLALVSVRLLVSAPPVRHRLDRVFVFAVGLFYGFVGLQTKNLWGVILSHSLGNVILYLVAPFH